MNFFCHVHNAVNRNASFPRFERFYSTLENIRKQLINFTATLFAVGMPAPFVVKHKFFLHCVMGNTWSIISIILHHLFRLYKVLSIEKPFQLDHHSKNGLEELVAEKDSKIYDTKDHEMAWKMPIHCKTKWLINCVFRVYLNVFYFIIKNVIRTVQDFWKKMCISK